MSFNRISRFYLFARPLGIACIPTCVMCSGRRGRRVWVGPISFGSGLGGCFDNTVCADAQDERRGVWPVSVPTICWAHLFAQHLCAHKIIRIFDLIKLLRRCECDAQPGSVSVCMWPYTQRETGFNGYVSIAKFGDFWKAFKYFQLWFTVRYCSLSTVKYTHGAFYLSKPRSRLKYHSWCFVENEYSESKPNKIHTKWRICCFCCIIMAFSCIRRGWYWIYHEGRYSGSGAMMR